jgi:hypothetical protein
MRVLSALFSPVLMLCVPIAWAADFPGTLKVTFQTTDCSGATGLASVNVDYIARIQPYDCPNGRKLKQVLTRAPAGIGEAFLISGEESTRLQTRIQQIMDARQKALEQQKPIVIQH